MRKTDAPRSPRIDAGEVARGTGPPGSGMGRAHPDGEERAMPGGRPPKGPRLADGLDGSKDAKRKLRVILETVAGETTVEQACEKLGIGPAAFHKLRERTLQEAAASLEPRKLGRPRKEKSPEEQRIEDLEKELFEAEFELRGARLREEIAVVMPHLLRDRDGNPRRQSHEKKGKKKRR